MENRRKGRRAHDEDYAIGDENEDSIDRRKKRHYDSSTEIARYCGRESVRTFGAVFPNHSYPIDVSSFRQLDSCRWCLDMAIFVGKSYDQVTEMCIFLINQFVLSPDKALAVYVQSPGSAFQYCGGVSNSCPSALLTLAWPQPGGQMQLTASDTPLNATIGVSVEDLSSLPTLNIRHYYHVEQVALKIGENLFSFLQSFSKAGEDGRIVVPLNLLDRWFVRFKDKARKDPDYLKQFQV